MKTNKELLQLLFDTTLLSDPLDGICINMERLLFRGNIDKPEFLKLNELITDNKPSINNEWRELTYHLSFIASHSAYWWTRTPIGKNQRLKFIKSLIHHYSNE